MPPKKKIDKDQPATDEWDVSDKCEISIPDLKAAIIAEGTCTYDLETTSLDPRRGRIEGVAFYVPNEKDPTRKPIRAWFPFVDGTMDVAEGGKLIPLRQPMDQIKTLEELRQIWLLKDVVAIRHNGIFDDAFLYVASGLDQPLVVENNIADSMLADYVADERRKRYGLKIRVEQVFGHKMTTYDEASGGQSEFGFSKKKPLGVYSCDDTYWTYRLWRWAMDQIREQDPPRQHADNWCSPLDNTPGVYSDLEKVYWKIEMRIQKILMEMEITGCFIDWKWLVEVQERVRKEQETILEEFKTKVGWVPNLRSPKQVSDFLYRSPEKGGLGLPTKNVSYNESLDQYETGDKAIKHRAKQFPLVGKLLKYRSLSVIDGSFCEKIIGLTREGSRLHARFRQTGTVIGRLSSADPVNLMNQPRAENLIRKSFCAHLADDTDPERLSLCLIDADYEQMELRMAAHLANERNMIDVFINTGACRAENGNPCRRYLFWECKDCKNEWAPDGWVTGAEAKPSLCPKCGKGKIKHQKRCRHVDPHQRTAEELSVPRNPLAKNCVTGESMVLTEHGFMRIDEIVEGDGRQKKSIGIVSDDGKIRRTESTYAGGEQDILSVETEYGLKIRATPDHEFMIMECGQIVRRRADELKPGDATIIMTGRNVHGSMVNLPGVEVEANTSYKDILLPQTLTPEISRFFGYLVAEGRVDTRLDQAHYQVQFGFAESSEGMISDFLHCVNVLVGDRFSTWRDETRKVVFYTITAKKLNVWLEMLGFGHSSADKSIPRCVRSAPWVLKREFLRAYFEGDGTNKQPSSVTGKGSYAVSCCSKSELLIRQIQAELANVDILGYVHKETRDTDKGPQDYWIWSIRRQRDITRFRELIGFVSTEKQAALDAALSEPVTDRANRYLDNVEPLLEMVYDKVKRKQKDKLREVIHRVGSAPAVRFGDTRLELLSDVLPKQIKGYVDAGIWTAKVESISLAGRALVYDLYEPERTAMVVGCNSLADCNFGLLYRMGPHKFCIYAGLYDDDGNPRVDYAEELIARWHAAYPGIHTWHEQVLHELIKDNYIAYNIARRRRRLDVEWHNNEYRAGTQAIQFKVSASCQELIKLAMIKIFDARNHKVANTPPAESKLWSKFRFMIQVHDELLFEGPKVLKEELCALVKNSMEGVATGMKVPFIADANAGRNWEEAH